MRNPQRFRSTTSTHLILCVTLLSLLNTSFARQSYPPGQSNNEAAGQAFRTVSPGVEHLRITRGTKSETEASGPWVINFLRADLRQIYLRVVHALDGGVGLETTSSIAARYRAIAAVNAGFFRTTGTYRGEPSGVLALEGKLISEPQDGRAAMGVIKRRGETEIMFGHLKFFGYVESDRRRRSINGINRPRGADELVLYTPEFHRTTLTTPDGVEVIVRKNKIIGIRNREGSSNIPTGGFVISASGKARDWVLSNLRVQSQVRVNTKLVPGDRKDSSLWERALYIVGGGPQLIKNGRVAITSEEEGVDARFVSDRHPRTAIARLKDGRMLVVTVDGRQPGVSVGMSLAELANLLLEFDASEAINLDGGGSTTMVVSGKLVNNPSDQTGERPVSDAILLFPRRLQPTHQIH